MWVLTAHPFWRYCIVGGVGFCVDWLILQAEVRFLGLDPVLGRFVSCFLALLVTWLLHRWFTFAAIGRPNFLELCRYLLSNGLGALVNVGIYSGMVMTMPSLGLTIPLVVASIIALAVNYCGAAFFVFTSRKR
ncbi:GtrA family protein [Salidesulfovibrio onnuriiensis]|uniref:GtrA family protein n=1 Tax=Salidesulfovibrio onnuriiensis TaxID=2583823 RepID=UPI0011CA0E46|nr:GtrA family protein [Salidesulfovibrio onnuriiensis]